MSWQDSIVRFYHWKDLQGNLWKEIVAERYDIILEWQEIYLGRGCTTKIEQHGFTRWKLTVQEVLAA